MKKILLLVVLLIANSTVFSQKMNEEKFKDLFDFDAVKADQDYYSQAIIQFQILQKLINKYGNIFHLFPSEQPKLFLEREKSADKTQFDIDNGVPTMVLFPNINDKVTLENRINEKLYELGVDRCQYEIPLELKDLDGGFQFNHYMFKSSNKAALDAFGIVKNSFDRETIYIIIDYLQHKDFVCTGLPKIRYGLGIRSEIKITNWENNLNIKESSLASLAASSEITSMKVNITVKTIGITGLESKLNIPNNTSFDVDTYADYQQIINFIRNFKDNSANGKDNKDIKFKPQLIPVMDEYRTSISQSFTPFYHSLEQLDKKLATLNKEKNKYEKYKKSDNEIERSMARIYDEKISAIFEEIEAIKDRKEKFSDANIYNSDITRYISILNFFDKTVANNQNITEEKDSLQKKSNLLASVSKEIDEIKKEYSPLKIASDFEEQGFKNLFAENLSGAIISFENAEKSYPRFHSVKEIADYLKKVNLSATPWKKVYSEILNKYSWKLSDDIIAELKKRS